MGYLITIVATLFLLVVSVQNYPHNQNSEQVSQLPEDIKVNADELGHGDIVFPRRKRQGRKLYSGVSRWPGGIVPYVMSPKFNVEEQSKILEAMNHFHEFTCIRFITRTEESNYVNITAENTNCWSVLGYNGIPQELNLEPCCCLGQKGSIVHELMHTLGFYHEQSRSDRDDFVIIDKHNIQPSELHNFDKITYLEDDVRGVGYDYSSIMHYSKYAFSKNGEPTILARGGQEIGQREGLSSKDVVKIQLLYCDEYTNNLLE